MKTLILGMWRSTHLREWIGAIVTPLSVALLGYFIARGQIENTERMAENNQDFLQRLEELKIESRDESQRQTLEFRQMQESLARELKVTEIFYDRIASSDPRERQRAIRAVESLAPQLVSKLIPYVANDPEEAPEIRQEAKRILAEHSSCCGGQDCKSKTTFCSSGTRRVPCPQELDREARSWRLRVASIDWGAAAREAEEKAQEVCVRAGGVKPQCIDSRERQKALLQQDLEQRFSIAELEGHAFAVSLAFEDDEGESWGSRERWSQRRIKVSPRALRDGFKARFQQSGASISVFIDQVSP